MMFAPISPILVVEDSDEDFDTFQEAAQRAGFQNEVRRVTTGEGCLSLLRGNQGKKLRPAFVLMDLNTPGTDGREALREIKSDANLGLLPVVILSTSSNPKDIAYCYGMGANAYHVKPIRYGDYLQILSTVFSYWLKSIALPILEEDQR